jgi:hypothetical protein
MIRALARIAWVLVAPAIASQASLAQQTCGMQGVTVTVTPECAAPGEMIKVTLTNNTNQVITLPSSCVYKSVHPSSDCTGQAVFTPLCLAVLTPIPPGQSATMPWDQLDDNVQQVPDGEYSFSIAYIGGACCASVTIGPPVSVYCTPKVNSQGCTPKINFTGLPSATDPNPFQVKATQVINHKTGMLFYGFGQAAIPFSGGILCVESPITRLPTMSSGGNPPPDDCSGRYSFDMNAHIQSGVDPQLVAGASVAAQYWQRDPAHPDMTGIGLTDAVQFCIQN